MALVLEVFSHSFLMTFKKNQCSKQWKKISIEMKHNNNLFVNRENKWDFNFWNLIVVLCSISDFAFVDAGYAFITVSIINML